MYVLVVAERRWREETRVAFGGLRDEDGVEPDFEFADDGRAALDLAHGETPDLVVIQVGVGPFGAFGLCRELKSDPDISCPVLLLLEREQDEWLARRFGADAWVARPWHAWEMERVAVRLTQDRRAEERETSAAHADRS